MSKKDKISKNVDDSLKLLYNVRKGKTLRIGVIGVKGSGKTSFINTLFCYSSKRGEKAKNFESKKDLYFAAPVDSIGTSKFLEFNQLKKYNLYLYDTPAIDKSINKVVVFLNNKIKVGVDEKDIHLKSVLKDGKLIPEKWVNSKKNVIGRVKIDVVIFVQNVDEYVKEFVKRKVEGKEFGLDEKKKFLNYDKLEYIIEECFKAKEKGNWHSPKNFYVVLTKWDKVNDLILDPKTKGFVTLCREELSTLHKDGKPRWVGPYITINCNNTPHGCKDMFHGCCLFGKSDEEALDARSSRTGAFLNLMKVIINLCQNRDVGSFI